MKYLFLFFLLLLTSCISKTEAPTTSETPSENFVDTYVDTLETSVSDARDVANTMTQEQNKLQEALWEIQE